MLWLYFYGGAGESTMHTEFGQVHQVMKNYNARQYECLAENPNTSSIDLING